MQKCPAARQKAPSAAITGTFSDDTTAPTITGRDTVDLDGDGYLDALHLTFSEPVLDSTVTAGDFDVQTVTGESFVSTTGGDTADDSDIYITFTAGTTFATDQTPTITYTAGTLTDFAGNFLEGLKILRGQTGVRIYSLED